MKTFLLAFLPENLIVDALSSVFYSTHEKCKSLCKVSSSASFKLDSIKTKMSDFLRSENDRVVMKVCKKKKDRALS